MLTKEFCSRSEQQVQRAEPLPGADRPDRQQRGPAGAGRLQAGRLQQATRAEVQDAGETI